MSTVLDNLVSQPYKHGFVTDIESETAPKGLNEDIIRMISAKKNEPEWLLEFRLKAYRHWLTMTEPQWPNVHYPKIDFQAISYYSAPKPRSSRRAWTRSIRNCCARSRNSACRCTSARRWPVWRSM